MIDSDLDIDCCWPGGNPESPRIAVGRIGSALELLGMKDVSLRPGARIPIAAFTDPETGYSCDIALTKNSLAVHNTELLRTYASIDPRVVDLGLLLKHWAKSRGICNPVEKTLNSYTLMLMMIQFLQMQPIPLVPSLQQLPSYWNGRTMFTGNDNKGHDVTEPVSKCNIYFYKAVTDEEKQKLQAFAARNTQTVEELLMSFFTFYGTQFNFRDQVISVRTGSPLTRKDKSEESDWIVKPTLSVEDPFETAFDTAHFVVGDGHWKVMNEFVRAAALVNRLQPEGQPANRLAYSSLEKDDLPERIAPEDFLKVLCGRD